ncbi:MAG: 3-hydroxybutyrate dehydrogenase [Rhodospirillales bacterium]|nr:3-hydroxybutyrate dehydrogenase [Rhodospirillales bacterium]
MTDEFSVFNRTFARGFLTGRTALVTGSSGGIGQAMARGLALAGAKVMLHGIEAPAQVEAIRAAIAGESGVEVAYLNGDLSQPDSIAALIGKSEARLGPLDILVNNAGVQHVAPIEDFPDAKWDLIAAVNLSAAFHTTKAVLGGMKERGFGRIVNTASAHGLVASPFKSAYIAAKHGIVGLTKATALEGAAFGVTANAICPGYVWTPLVERQIPDTAKARGIGEEEVVKDVMLGNQPTKAFVTVEECAALCVYLCSGLAGSITGAALSIDGGWIAR